MEIIMLLGSIGLMGVAGVGVSSAFKFFHHYEPNFNNKKPSIKEGGVNHDRIENLRKNVRSNS